MEQILKEEQDFSRKVRWARAFLYRDQHLEKDETVESGDSAVAVSSESWGVTGDQARKVDKDMTCRQA